MRRTGYLRPGVSAWTLRNLSQHKLLDGKQFFAFCPAGRVTNTAEMSRARWKQQLCWWQETSLISSLRKGRFLPRAELPQLSRAEELRGMQSPKAGRRAAQKLLRRREIIPAQSSSFHHPSPPPAFSVHNLYSRGETLSKCPSAAPWSKGRGAGTNPFPRDFGQWERKSSAQEWGSKAQTPSWASSAQAGLRGDEHRNIYPH